MFKNVFSIVGALVAVVGVAIAVGGLAFGSGSDRFGLLVPGGFMVLFGLGFFRTGRRIGKVVWRGSDVLETGRPGTGTITKMWETGMTINDQPVFGFDLDLEVDGVAAGTASTQQMVPRMLAGAVLPGHTVAVRVDQEDPTSVVIDWSEMPVPAGGVVDPEEMGAGQIAAALADGIKSGAVDPPSSAADLLRSGRRGTARITVVADAGEFGELGLARGEPDLADDRLYVFEADVKLPGRSPYPAKFGHRVPDRLIGRVGPGLELVVAVDRDDDNSIAVDWEASVPEDSES